MEFKVGKSYQHNNGRIYECIHIGTRPTFLTERGFAVSGDWWFIDNLSKYTPPPEPVITEKYGLTTCYGNQTIWYSEQRLHDNLKATFVDGELSSIKKVKTPHELDEL